jgi:hypothetical protein
MSHSQLWCRDSWNTWPFLCFGLGNTPAKNMLTLREMELFGSTEMLQARESLSQNLLNGSHNAADVAPICRNDDIDPASDDARDGSSYSPLNK